MSVAFGKQFELLREALERSRAELAESSGVEQDELSPRLVELRQLAGAFGLAVSELFEDRIAGR